MMMLLGSINQTKHAISDLDETTPKQNTIKNINIYI